MRRLYAPGFTAEGEVGLVGARIGGQLDCDGATFRNPDGTALDADMLTVNQRMACRDGRQNSKWNVSSTWGWLRCARCARGTTADAASVAALPTPSSRCAYVSLVIEIEPWPRIFETTAMSAPAARSSRAGVAAGVWVAGC